MVKKFAFFIVCSLFSAFIFQSGVYAREIRVGIYQNEPKLFFDRYGSAEGIFPDLLKNIASRENWKLKFVPCAWQRCLEMMQSGEIDLMPDVAHNEAREALFDFHKVPSLDSWSVIYRRPGVNIQSLRDLDKKSVAVLNNSVQQDFLLQALEGFGVNAKFIPVESFDQGFEEVQAGRIDAIAVNHLYGSYSSKKYGLEETPIIFLPSSLFVVTKKGTNPDLLATLDQYFEQWREDPRSPLFQTLKKWTGDERIAVVPKFVWWALGLTGFVLLLLAAEALFLRREVRLRTAEIRESEIKLSSILNNVGSCIYIKGADLRYQYANKVTCENIGLTEKEILGKLDLDLYDEPAAKAMAVIDREVIQTKKRYSGEEIIIGLNNTVARTFFSVKIPLLNALGEVSAICGISTDITDQLEFSKKLDRLSHFDPLTGLLNRTHFFEQADQRSKDVSRPIGQCAIVLINLDHFKDLNDSKGHQVGDLLLEHVADQLRETQQPHYLLARLTGDSFAIFIDAFTVGHALIRQSISTLTQQIQSVIARPQYLNGFTYQGTCSIGISIFDPLSTSVQEGFKYAEIALYQAKNTTSGSVRIFEPQMEEIAASRLKLETELREAIECQQLEVFYQPQVDSFGTLFGFEALIRWKHPRYGLYSPAAFVPLAESNGQILMIGKFVLETVCRQLESWAGQSESAKMILSLNVSAREFFDEGFVEGVIDTLSRYRFDPNCLELELTESQFIKNFDQALVKISTLKDMGIRLTIDDFGTGYSSLNRLKQLPFDQIKIDASFVRDMVISQSDAAIVKTIIDLGKTLGVEVLAEGVETQAQLDALIAFGCTKFQGFLHGKPMPILQVQAHYLFLRDTTVEG